MSYVAPVKRSRIVFKASDILVEPRKKSSAIKGDIPHFTIKYDSKANIYEYTQVKRMPNEKIEQYTSPFFIPRSPKELYYKTILKRNFNPEQDLPIKINMNMYINAVVADLNTKISSSPYYKDSFTRDITYPRRMVMNSACDVKQCIEDSEMFDLEPTIAENCVLGAFENSADGNLVLKSDKENLQTLFDYIKAYGEKSRFHVITGGPGTGKTRKAIVDHCAEDGKVLVVSLSNLVGANFVKRMNNFFGAGVGHREFMSYTKLNFTAELTLQGYNTIIFEEASMLSMNEIRLVLKVMRANPDANIVILGDTKQLPSFLGRGNLLYSIISEFPDLTETLVTQHRLPKEIIDETNSLSENGNFPKLVSKVDAALIINEWVASNKNFMLLAFSNAAVQNMNMYVLNLIYPYLSNCKDFYEILNAMQIGDSIKCRATQNISIKDSEEKRGYDFLNNETVMITKHDFRQVICRSMDFSKPQKIISIADAASAFNLAYASTVHKAQGLEADYCFYKDDASQYLGNLNLSYVAFTRCKIEAIVSSERNIRRKFLEYNNVFNHLANFSEPLDELDDDELET